jgi:hypothetical protein
MSDSKLIPERDCQFCGGSGWYSTEIRDEFGELVYTFSNECACKYEAMKRALFPE